MNDSRRQRIRLRWICQVCISASLCGVWFARIGDAAQKNNKPTAAQKRDEQRENEAVRKAQDHLNAVQKDLKQAEADLRDAQQAVRHALQRRQQATAALQKTLDRLEADHADLTGLTAARRSLKALQAEFETQAVPVRKALEMQPDYQAAVADVARLKKALQPDNEVVDVDRQQLAKEQLTATAKIRDREQAAFRRDAGLTALLGKIEHAESQVQVANTRFEKAVADDGDLRSARKAFEESKDAEDRAEQAVSKEIRSVASVRAKLVQATQQLQQKKLQDARDDNRKKK